MHLRIERQPDERRWAALDGDQLVGALDYREQAGSIALTHTFTRPDRRGQGIAARLVQHAVDEIDQEGDRRIVPTCWYVADWFAAHPDRAELLAD